MVFRMKEMRNNQRPKIPTTGKIGRLVANIEKEIDQAVMLDVMEEIDQFTSASNRAEKAEWIKEAIERLARKVGRKSSIKIMEKCGRECCGLKHSEHAKQLMDESISIEEFVNKLSRGGIRFSLKGKSSIIGEYSKCYCPMVNQAPHPFPSNIYCHCGVGYVKQQFESAFGRPIEVKIMQSVITGAETCRFIVTI